MILHNLVELVKQHHPHMGEMEIRYLLNRASDDFCAKTDILKDSFSLGNNVDADNVTALKRYYTIPSDVLKIRDVYLYDVLITRLIGKPIIDDTNIEEM